MMWAIEPDDAAERTRRARYWWFAFDHTTWWGKTQPLPTYEEWCGRQPA